VELFTNLFHTLESKESCQIVAALT